jgi:hypothetical protein
LSADIRPVAGARQQRHLAVAHVPRAEMMPWFGWRKIEAIAANAEKRCGAGPPICQAWRPVPLISTRC